MHKWQLHEAKNKLSNLIESAMHGSPQCITRRGMDAVVVIGIKEYQKMRQSKKGLKSMLMQQGPKFEDFELTRVNNPAREVEL